MEIPNLSIIKQRKLRDASSAFNSLEFSNSGALLYSVPNRIGIWCFFDGRLQKFRIRCNDGCDVVKVISNKLVAHSNTKNYNLTLIDYENIRKLRTFESHTARIKTVSVFGDGSSDLLITSSEDRTVKFWDRRDRYENTSMICHSAPLTAYHPTGLLFALSLDSHILELYHVINKSTPVYTFKVERVFAIEWMQMKYSKDGKYIVVTTNSNFVHIFDGINAVLLKTFSGECEMRFRTSELDDELN